MTLSNDLVGTPLEPVTRTWTDHDTNLYALAVGAGQRDALRELDFTTEGGKVYPTFASLAGNACGVGGLLRALGDDVDATQMLHGEEKLHLQRPLPRAAKVISSGTISAIWDKGSSTVVEATVETADAQSGEVYSRTTSAMFFRGVGGWGGERGPAGRPAPPERPPDRVVQATTRPDQALLYRLTGDRNPLHVNPEAAAAAGFERPILHGMCVYGTVGRVLLNAYADADPARFETLRARFSRPTMPGDTLTISCWHVDDRTVEFAVTNQDGSLVMNNGVFTRRA